MPPTVSTLDLIRQRGRRGDSPRARGDKFKLALVIEGGGMRGVVSGGMVSALEVLGLRNVFDAVYGSSSGAMAGAYFVAGQARFGTTIYYQCINNTRFIRKLNVFSSGKIMDTGFLLDNICRKARPLQASRVILSDIPLHVIASSVTKRSSVVLSGFSKEHEVFEALRCSINAPGIAGSPVSFQGDFLLDAALYEPIPFKSARSQGATHALVLLTRAAGCARRPTSRLHSAFWKFILRDQPRAIVSDYIQSWETYNEEIEKVSDAEKGGLPDIHAQRISLSAPYGNVPQLETDRKVLLAGAMAGFEAVFKALGIEDIVATQVLGGDFHTLPDGDDALVK